MNRRALRALALAGAGLVMGLAGAACSSAQPTPILKYTAAPATDTPAPTATPAPTTKPAPTPVTTITPWPTLAPTPSKTPGPSQTAKPTALVTPGPTSPGASCSGKASNQAWFVEAANGGNFTVYCATKLATGWGLAITPGTSWSASRSGDTVLIYYQYRNTATRLEVCEGTFDASLCSGKTGVLGTATFGGLTGELDSTADGFAIRVAPGTNHAYTLLGRNVSQATLVSIGQALKVVPKA